MASISIKDLTRNISLDHEAMTSITGGARRRNQHPIMPALPAGGFRITTCPWDPDNPLAQEAPAKRTPSK